MLPPSEWGSSLIIGRGRGADNRVHQTSSGSGFTKSLQRLSKAARQEAVGDPRFEAGGSHHKVGAR
ncbi:hypothetical protein [Nitrobacter sp.]|uniref:hypothetical protein n=1 Tax=Nitrobacter sp. TaxID=29420 RepID=UPI003F64D665